MSPILIGGPICWALWNILAESLENYNHIFRFWFEETLTQRLLSQKKESVSRVQILDKAVWKGMNLFVPFWTMIK